MKGGFYMWRGDVWCGEEVVDEVRYPCILGIYIKQGFVDRGDLDEIGTRGR